EVGVAGGDSGGPNFINGLISGINSYGLSFGTNFGDIGGGLNSSFGEFSGYVPTFIHADFIRAAMVNVPVVAVSEPSMLALMSLGLFSIGASARRRKTGSSTQRSINGGKN
ncbi:PEP-CTERM sorting domain-containing protein, partial [Rheinheimera baltica]